MSSLRSAASTLLGVVSRSRQTSSLMARRPSQPAPRAALADQLLGLGRPRGTGLVGGHRRLALLPRVEDRVDDRPLPDDLVVAREERRLAPHRVLDQALVGLGR